MPRPALAVTLAAATACAVSAQWRPAPVRAAPASITLAPTGALTLALHYRTWDGHFLDGVSLPAGVRVWGGGGGKVVGCR